MVEKRQIVILECEGVLVFPVPQWGNKVERFIRDFYQMIWGWEDMNVE